MRSTLPLALVFSMLPLVACAAPPPPPATPQSEAPIAPRRDDREWLHQVIYLVVTDRFANGNPANDGLAPADCFDRSNPQLFHGGDLAGLRAHIPYLAELGATAVWTTPLYAQVPLRDGSCGYHGYWADYVDADDGALEPKLGTWDDVAALTSALHAARMRFVLDMVVNHSGRGARIVSQHPGWFHDDATCAARGDAIVDCPLHGLPDFAQEQPLVSEYLTSLSRHWVERVRPDGIRLDTAKHMPPSYLAGSLVPGLRAADPDLFLIAEVFDPDSFSRLVPVLDAGFDAAFHFPLQRAFVETFAKGGSVNQVGDMVTATLSTVGPERALRLVTMLDNHDVPRFMSAAPPGLSPEELSRRYAVALTALFTLPGIPQVYQGDELGMVGVYPDNRRDMPAWAFDRDARPGAHDGTIGDAEATWTLVKRLAKLRVEEPALWNGDYRELARQSPGAPDVLAFTRASRSRSAGRSLLVLLGNDDRAAMMSVPLGNGAKAGPWPDGTVLRELSGSGAPGRLIVSRQAVVVTLAPHTAAIYGVD